MTIYGHMSRDSTPLDAGIDPTQPAESNEPTPQTIQRVQGPENGRAVATTPDFLRDQVRVHDRQARAHGEDPPVYAVALYWAPRRQFNGF